MDIQGAQFSNKAKIPQEQKHQPESEALAFSQSLKHAAETVTQVFAPEESEKQRFKKKKMESDPISSVSDDENETESVYKTVEKIKKKIKDLVALEQKRLGL